VVEVFFLNDENQYVEIELGPRGQHIVLLLNGQRKTVRHSLPINYINVQRTDSDWRGEALIPIEYLPPNVTKMNAYAIHGTGDKRVYEALYPVSPGSEGPDFHNLTAFNEFNSSIILATPVTTLSATWQESLIGVRTLNISTTWTNEVLPYNETTQLKLSVNGTNLEVLIDAPFFNNLGFSQNHFAGGTVHLFLLSVTGEYLELQFGPWKNYFVDFWIDNKTRNGYLVAAIDYKAEINKIAKRWNATAKVPLLYLPPKVTKCNAFMTHDQNGKKPFLTALYPAGPGKPIDYVNSSYYRAIDLDILYPWMTNTTCSPVWKYINVKCGSSWSPQNTTDAPDCSGAVSYIIEHSLFLVSFFSVVLIYVFNF